MTKKKKSDQSDALSIAQNSSKNYFLEIVDTLEEQKSLRSYRISKL